MESPIAVGIIRPFTAPKAVAKLLGQDTAGTRPGQLHLVNELAAREFEHRVRRTRAKQRRCWCRSQ